MRSNFLIHWTGRDICARVSGLNESFRKDYAERLVSILTEGFWMTAPNERLEGFNKSWIAYETPMTCFTEIRLSQAREHASRYGFLGVGVDRRFVLDRYGGPVHYVRNHTAECVVGNVEEIRSFLKDRDSDRHSYFAINTSFMKAMSNLNTDDFQFLNEQEWRIVHTERQEREHRILATGLARPKYRVPISASELQLVVFPDDDVRRIAQSDARLDPWLRRSTRQPILLTVEDCQHF